MYEQIVIIALFFNPISYQFNKLFKLIRITILNSICHKWLNEAKEIN